VIQFLVEYFLCFQLIRFEVIGEHKGSDFFASQFNTHSFQLIRFEVIGEREKITALTWEERGFQLIRFEVIGEPGQRLGSSGCWQVAKFPTNPI
jgi:hypothetical protein